MPRNKKPAVIRTEKPRIKKGDKVVVVSGADRSSEPREVLHVFPDTGKVLVKETNMRWKHQRRSQQNPKGGRTRKEIPIDLSNVMLFSEKAGKGVRVRIELETHKNAAGEERQRRVRVGVCGTRFD